MLLIIRADNFLSLEFSAETFQSISHVAMVKYYLNNGVSLSYLSNHLVVPVCEKGLLNLILENPGMLSDILEGRAPQVEHAHVAKYLCVPRDTAQALQSNIWQ